MKKKTGAKVDAVDMPRTLEECRELESIAGEDGFKRFGDKYLILCFVREKAKKVETEVLPAYTVAQARETIKQQLAQGWRIFFRIWGDLYMKD